MTAREIKVVAVTCDHCGDTKRAEGTETWPLPAHWHHVSNPGENSMDLCRSCWVAWMEERGGQTD